MKRTTPTNRRTGLPLPLVLLALFVLATGCERPPMEAEQRNFRGLAIETITNPRLAAERVEANAVPEPLPPVEPGPPSDTIFKNLEVLNDTGATEFTRLMGAITTWVSPQEGCNYCHVGGDFANEGIYTKDVARRMIQMTRTINSEWKDHVGDTGVTCYTCHRGQVVPSQYWTKNPDALEDGRRVGYTAGQNKAAPNVGLTSLPADPFSALLTGESQPEIRVQATSALPGTHEASIKTTEWTYALMVHMSSGLGVNCTYCHNSRSFGVWPASTPARATAWHGIRMVRDLNDNYLTPLGDVFPANRKGPLGDVFKINCATCHQGVNKPLYGAQMAADYPSLIGESSKDEGEADAMEADAVEGEGEMPVDGEMPADSEPAEASTETEEAMHQQPSSPEPATQNVGGMAPDTAPTAPAPA